MEEQAFQEYNQMVFNKIMDTDIFKVFSEEFMDGNYDRIDSICGGSEKFLDYCDSIIRYILHAGIPDKGSANLYVVNGLDMHWSIYRDTKDNGEFLLALAFLAFAPPHPTGDELTGYSGAVFSSFSFDEQDTNFRLSFNDSLSGLQARIADENDKYEKFLLTSGFQINGDVWELTLTQAESDNLLAAYHAFTIFPFVDDEEIEGDDEVETLDDIKLVCRTDFVNCHIDFDLFFFSEGDPRITIREFMNYIKRYQENIGVRNEKN